MSRTVAIEGSDAGRGGRPGPRDGRDSVDLAAAPDGAWGAHPSSIPAHNNAYAGTAAPLLQQTRDAHRCAREGGSGRAQGTRNDETTVAIEDRNFVDWHGGCQHALVWVADVDTPEVREAVAAMRDRLGHLLLPRYDRQPHVTVAFGGLAPEPGATPMSVLYPPDLADLHAARVRDLGVAPFTVRITGWDTFTTTPYLAVEAPQLAVLHEALIRERPRTADFAPTYVTHVTAGHYAMSVPLDDVRRRLAGFQFPDLEVGVDHLTLASYETRDIAGPLAVARIVELVETP